MHGIDGFYEKVWVPDFANDELMAVITSTSTYCGGAHPNHWATFSNFDRQTGALLDPAEWFNQWGAKVGEYGSLEMSAALREAVIASWTPTSDGEGVESCAEYAADQLYWNYLLQAGGITFQPDLPHVATACEDLITLPWDELQPFLSPAGKALAARAQR